MLAALRAKVVPGAIAMVAARAEIHQGAAIDAVEVVGLVRTVTVRAGIEWRGWQLLDTGWFLCGLQRDIGGFADRGRMNGLFKREGHFVRALVTALRLLL